jgi:pimeloyl-ACP methyl ester carboxylesterase
MGYCSEYLTDWMVWMSEAVLAGAVQHVVHVNGVDLCWFEWGAEYNEGETVLLVHATGFHARCWDKTVDSLEGKHVIALDMRGHGRSDKIAPFNWQMFGEDLVQFVAALDLNNIVGVGHSMGGHCTIQAAARAKNRFDRIVLVDPVVMAPEYYKEQQAEHSAWLDDDGVHPVARRKNYFLDAQAMFANFQGRGPYGLWREDVLRDYCDYGIVANTLGDGFVLACPPEVEAAIYMGSALHDIYEFVRSIDIPAKILRAQQRDPERQEMDFSKSPTWVGLAGEFKNGRDVYLPEFTHFIPMEKPDLVARHILDQDF